MIGISQISATPVGHRASKMKPIPRGVVPAKGVTAGAYGSVADFYFNQKFVSHVISTHTWKSLEATKRVYTFTDIETELARCRVAGKKLILRISTNFLTNGAGITANPDWLWTAGGGPCYRRSITQSNQATKYDAYEPWDNSWLNDYTILMQKLGNTYDQNPDVSAVIISGYNCKFTELVTTNSSGATDNNWDNDGGLGANANVNYTDAGYLAAIKQSMLNVANAWPTTLKLWRGVKFNIERNRLDQYSVYNEIATWARNALGANVSFGSTGLDNNDGSPTTPKNITSSTDATPIVVTATAHGYSTDDYVFIIGHTTNIAANGLWLVTATGTNTFSLNGSVGSGAGMGADGTVQNLSDPVYAHVRDRTTGVRRHAQIGNVTPPTQANVATSAALAIALDAHHCEAGAGDWTREEITGATNATPIVLTISSGHGFIDGDVVTVQNVQGNTAANGKWTLPVGSTGSASITLTGSVGNGVYTASTGEMYHIGANQGWIDAASLPWRN